MAKYKMKVTLELNYDLDTAEHESELADQEVDGDSEQELREWIQGCLDYDVTEFGAPEVQKIELEKQKE